MGGKNAQTQPAGIPSEQTTAGRPPAKSLTAQAAGGLQSLLGYCSKDRRTTETSDSYRVGQVGRDHSGHWSHCWPCIQHRIASRQFLSISSEADRAAFHQGCYSRLLLMPWHHPLRLRPVSEHPESVTEARVNPLINQSHLLHHHLPHSRGCTFSMKAFDSDSKGFPWSSSYRKP